MTDYAICAAAEGKSRSSIAIVTSSVRYFSDFLRDNGASTDALDVSATHLRICSLYLTQKPCFSGHRLTPAQPRGFSGHTINTYMWSTRGFFSWLMVEDILDENPFDRVKVPRCPRRVIPTFSESQIAQLLAAIDTTTSTGCRDCTMILVMLDCGLRVSELWWG